MVQGSLLEEEKLASAANAICESDVCYNVNLQVDEEFMRLYEEAKALSGGRDMQSLLKKI